MRAGCRRSSTAADLLRMWHGAAADAAMVAALDTYFTVMAESGLSGSSFTARIVASTRASLAARRSVRGARSPGRCMAARRARRWICSMQSRRRPISMRGWRRSCAPGERLMGFGHRVFRGNDPRAEAMRAALRRMGPPAGRLTFASHVEARVAAVLERVKPGRSLPANVEITAALLLDAVGVPARGVHAGVCGVALRRMDRACDGAAEDRADDPAGIALRWRNGCEISHRTATVVGCSIASGVARRGGGEGMPDGYRREGTGPRGQHPR